MRVLKKSLTSLSAVALMTVSVGAQASVRPSESVVTPSASLASVTRASGNAVQGNQLVGSEEWILAAIALGLVIWGIVELTESP